MKKDFTNKTTESLHKELKSLQAVSSALVIILVLLLGISIFGLLTKEKNGAFIALISVAFSLSSIFFMLYSNIKSIKSEIKERG